MSKNSSKKIPSIPHKISKFLSREPQSCIWCESLTPTNAHE
ncbi:hypothetical protein CNEO3_70060 [Clostridium neonatale]|nr:hypothetical protein CNEO4_440040 [Clostridium neonatale]CAI3680850.1 hypothetical protein CNEO4_470060 [Clostridium neonatale]CAI3711953.1 hypothetical protein CNEO3_70060 [Clostridium neonatale]